MGGSAKHFYLFFYAYKCPLHGGNPVHALTFSQELSMNEDVHLCIVHILIIFPHSHHRNPFYALTFSQENFHERRCAFMHCAYSRHFFPFT